MSRGKRIRDAIGLLPPSSLVHGANDASGVRSSQHPWKALIRSPSPLLAATLLVLSLLGCAGASSSVELSATEPIADAPPSPTFPVLEGDLAVLGTNDMRRVLEQVDWAEAQGLDDPTKADTRVAILPLSPLSPVQLAALRNRRIQFRYCYRVAQRTNPDTNGFLRVDLQFEDDKVVGRGVERAGLTTGVQSCVHHGVRRWTLEDAPELVQLLVVMGDPEAPADED